nr:MAG TPA: hypothetical protein [Caudoviricetes sp.]
MSEKQRRKASLLHQDCGQYVCTGTHTRVQERCHSVCKRHITLLEVKRNG